MAGTALVTGGTGYIAGELIDQLLAKGWTVHTTVRSKAKSEARLQRRWPDAGEQLKLFEADLMNDAGWAEANAGCSHVAHVASPFPVGVPKDENDLIVPAKQGTLRALRSAKEAGVSRFVQTSSSAAIAYGHSADKTDFDEEDWTNLEAPNVQPYVKSKTIAELAAREWVRDHGEGMVFCSVNPVAVLGPVANDDLSASIEFVRRFLDGEIPAIPRIGFTVVDVRDVASLHLLALEADDDKVRDGRFAAASDFMWMEEMAAVLREQLGAEARKVPTRRMPNWLLKTLAVFSADIRQLAGEVGKRKVVSGRRAREELGWTAIDGRQSVIDTARSLIAEGVVQVR